MLRVLRGLDRPLSNRMPIRVHTGTADAVGEIVLLDADELGPGDEGLVQFRMEHPLVCAPGDRFILRYPSPPRTIGGGAVLDPHPPHRWRRFKPDVIARVERLE